MPLCRSVCSGLFLALAIGLVGCSDGPPMGDVSGSVTVDGAPSPDGYITFTPTDGTKTPQGSDIKGGKYSIRVALGESKVEIRIPKKIGEKKLYDTPDSPVAPVFEETLPDKFHDKTELTFDVKAGANEKNWDVTSKAKK